MTVTIMLDTETWGKRPGCDIRSIGACVFSTDTGFVHDGSLGTIRPFYIACHNPTVPDLNKAKSGEEWYTRWDSTSQAYRKYPLARDPDTVKWWSEQSDDAQAAFADPVDLRDALSAFTRWYTTIDLQDVNNRNHGVRLYAHGPQFDCSILEAAYHAVGLPVPWHYRAPRDTRTVFDVCGVGDHSEWVSRYPVGTAHHALDDAVSQARAVCGAMERLRGMERDARRYAWLRDGNAYQPEENCYRGGEDLDRLCDSEGEYRG